MPVGLHALEDLLRVVQHRGRRVQRERAVGLDPGVVPARVGGPLDGEHVVGEVDAEARVSEDLGEPFVARPGAVRGVVLISMECTVVPPRPEVRTE